MATTPPDTDEKVTLTISRNDFDVLYSALESRKQLYSLYANNPKKLKVDSVWDERRKEIHTLQSLLLNQLPTPCTK